MGSGMDTYWKNRRVRDHILHRDNLIDFLIKLKVLKFKNNVLIIESRGLLCNKCNKAIGLLKDSVELLRRTIDYLS